MVSFSCPQNSEICIHFDILSLLKEACMLLLGCVILLEHMRYTVLIASEYIVLMWLMLVFVSKYKESQILVLVHS